MLSNLYHLPKMTSESVSGSELSWVQQKQQFPPSRMEQLMEPREAINLNKCTNRAIPTRTTWKRVKDSHSPNPPYRARAHVRVRVSTNVKFQTTTTVDISWCPQELTISQFINSKIPGRCQRPRTGQSPRVWKTPHSCHTILALKIRVLKGGWATQTLENIHRWIYFVMQ